MKLYVASSWRNDSSLDEIHRILRVAGHDTMDWRKHGKTDSLQTIANLDWQLLDKSDGVVLVLPSNQSSHIEAGVAIGSQRPVFVTYVAEHKYEPMYLWATAYVPVEELVGAIERYEEFAAAEHYPNDERVCCGKADCLCMNGE